MNAALKMLIAVGIGICAGLLIRLLFSVNAQTYLSTQILHPVYEFWIRLLTVCSAPVVFLMVCSCVLNSGTIEEEGGSTKRIVFRYFVFSLFAAVIAVLVSGIYALKTVHFGQMTGIGAYIDGILNIMPDNVITPLMQSNTPQILLIAFVAGYGILYLGSGAGALRTLVHQGNMLGLVVTETVSRLVPYFAGILICMEIVENSLRTFRGIWVVLLLSVVVSACVLFAMNVYVSVRKKVSLGLLFRKLRPPFLRVIKSGGIDAGFGQMERSCVDQLGLERHFTSVSLPHGLVLYMPVNVIGTLLFTIYASVSYQVDISFGWLLIAIVLSVFLFVATPPVPGANLLAYIMIFAQLGVPAVALIDAMIFDIIFGIFASAANQTLLQIELILQADKIGLLDKEKLKR